MTSPSVIVSNFNGLRFLPKLFESLRSQSLRPLEIIVVDRNSTDGSNTYLDAQSDIRRLQEPPESGLVCGYHAGAQIARGDLLFFCNEDMWFAHDCLEKLAAPINLAQRIAASDGWHWSYDGAEWLHGGTRFAPARWAVNSPHPRWAAHFQVPLPQGSHVPFPCAGAFLIHRHVYAELGGWDRSFFLDHEDIDLFIRAWQQNWTCALVPDARIHHAVNASQQQSSQRLNRQVSRRRYISQRASLAIIAAKYFSAPALALNALHWPAVFFKNLLTGQWPTAARDLAVAAEILRRYPDAWKFRRNNSTRNLQKPGESFFTDPAFRLTSDSKGQ